MTETVRPEPSRLYRWLVLIFVSLAMFGNYYVYDALSPLADVLKQQLGFTDLDIGFLQAIYSFPKFLPWWLAVSSLTASGCGSR